MELYKVVRKTKRGYTSCIVNPRARVVYSTEQPTTPEFGWLFVFTSLDAALDFIHTNVLRGVRVFTVSTEETLVPEGRYIPLADSTLIELRNFWQGHAAEKDTLLPRNTLFARGVTLLQEVTRRSQ